MVFQVLAKFNSILLFILHYVFFLSNFFILNKVIKYTFQIIPQQINVIFILNFFCIHFDFGYYRLDRFDNFHVIIWAQFLDCLDLVDDRHTSSLRYLVPSNRHDQFDIFGLIKYHLAYKAIDDLNERTAWIFKACNVRIDKFLTWHLIEMRNECLRRGVRVTNLKQTFQFFILQFLLKRFCLINDSRTTSATIWSFHF